MKIVKTNIEGLLVLEPKVFTDSRGYFLESWNNKVFLENNLDFKPVQQNESKSSFGVVRGLHYQLAPYSQAKLVRVILGKVLDVAVDLRKNSPSFGKYYSVILSEENKKQFFIPKGFAHGFSVLSDFAIFSYMCDEYYSPEHERAISYNDNFLNIDWQVPFDKMIISNKDMAAPCFKTAEYNF
ncbi:MAG TPA: dTDP-4-dehydrorhamnose 3,5-epimerase [Bacteroidales bacterium]|nr:dTDP-4-dehydrorhamnose 3,5-epimerase [Bacteroidales bacterium]HQB20754.1 dTDP-4-dehydrorhamnose 3,5-epimerase [Bacteroidales bacterium]